MNTEKKANRKQTHIASADGYNEGERSAVTLCQGRLANVVAYSARPFGFEDCPECKASKAAIESEHGEGAPRFVYLRAVETVSLTAAEVKGPSVVLSLALALAQAKEQAEQKKEPFTVYLIQFGPYEGRHTFEPSSVAVPSTWKAVQTFEPEAEPLEVGGTEIESSEPTAPPPDAMPLALEIEDAAPRRCMFLPHDERDERSGHLKAVHITCGCGKLSAVVRDDTLQTSEDELRRRAFSEYAAHVGTVEPPIRVVCEYCQRGVALDADGANHVAGGALDVKPCAAAFDAMIEGGNVGPAFAEAIAAAQRFANAERSPFVVYAAKTCYLVRRYTFRLPESLKASHAKLIEPLPSDEGAKPFVVHAGRGVMLGGAPTDSAWMVCGKRIKALRVFATAPTGERVENCPDCQARAKEEFAPDTRFAFVLEGYPAPERHELLTVFAGEGLLLECFAACTCGEWNYKAHGEENGFREEFLKECQAVHAEHVAAVPPPRSKKDEILRLYEEGTTDIAELVRRVKARPSYVAQVLQHAGHLEGAFDLYTTTGREQNVYTRYFRNVLAFRNVEAARESVQRIDRLYNYFERLGDRAGQHQACILALVGKNRARWSGKLEESEIFHEWLVTH